MVLGLWLTLESSKLYFCEDMSIKMVKKRSWCSSYFEVLCSGRSLASCAPLRWDVVFGWCFRWNWSWFRDELVKGSARPHTTSTYQGGLHAMPAKRLALHKLRGCVGGWVAFFCYVRTQKKKWYQARHKSQPPTYQTRHICFRHLPEKPNPPPPTIFLPFVLLTPSPLSVHHATSLPFVLRLPRSSHKSQRRMKGKKPARPLDWHCMTWKKRYLPGTLSKTLAGLGLPMKACGMISCSRVAAKNRSECKTV